MRLSEGSVINNVERLEREEEIEKEAQSESLTEQNGEREIPSDKEEASTNEG